MTNQQRSKSLPKNNNKTLFSLRFCEKKTCPSDTLSLHPKKIGENQFFHKVFKMKLFQATFVTAVSAWGNNGVWNTEWIVELTKRWILSRLEQVKIVVRYLEF